jgi:succinyl-CoA synthetase beta subunit
MKLLEYQAKSLLRKAGLPVPRGEVVFSAVGVKSALAALGVETGVAKAQAYTGGRGKAGGVRFFHNATEAVDTAARLIGTTLVTGQTDPEGVKIRAVLLEEQSQVSRELYLAVALDRAKAGIVFILSPEGGMDIEEIAGRAPEKILKLYPEWGLGPDDALSQKASAFLGLNAEQSGEFADIARKLYDLYVARDCAMLEINPLAVNASGHLILLDCKIDIDENALYRQRDTGGDPDAGKDADEIEAATYGLSYIKLDGDIGCMVNGAGLAMATMDIISRHGAKPANFLDVGGSATEEAVTRGFEILSAGKRVKAILVNIFGGIMPCDRVARGIIKAVRNTGLQVPLVVRMEGVNMEEGRALIRESGLNVVFAGDLEDAARQAARIVAAAGV